MKEIGIAHVLTEKRREKGITQDELAEYIGVSKASVSKWETGQSYPDITFLPLLAAYFNISIDELMNYAPQMEKGDMRRLYRRLAGDFAGKPFDAVMGEVREIVRKYYSCWPLLYQMAALIINHHMLARDADAQKGLLCEAEEICARVRTQSGDVRLAHEAALLEAASALMRGDALPVFGLLGEEMPLLSSEGMIIAQAHQMQGNAGKAREVLEIGIYQHLLMLVGSMPGFLMLSMEDDARVEEIVRRTRAVADAFHLEELNSNVTAQFYLAAAQAYCMRGKADEAIGMLARYTDLCVSGRFAYTMRGDDFFDALDAWFENFDLGKDAPRSRRLIEESMFEGVARNPAFQMLAERPEFIRMVDALKANREG